MCVHSFRHSLDSQTLWHNSVISVVVSSPLCLQLWWNVVNTRWLSSPGCVSLLRSLAVGLEGLCIFWFWSGCFEDILSPSESCTGLYSIQTIGWVHQCFLWENYRYCLWWLRSCGGLTSWGSLVFSRHSCCHPMPLSPLWSSTGPRSSSHQLLSSHLWMAELTSLYLKDALSSFICWSTSFGYRDLWCRSWPRVVFSSCNSLSQKTVILLWCFQWGFLHPNSARRLCLRLWL